jgi:hypothetical protein
VFEASGGYAHGAAERAVNIRYGDEGEREQERERKYLDGVKFEIIGAKHAGRHGRNNPSNDQDSPQYARELGLAL